MKFLTYAYVLLETTLTLNYLNSKKEYPGIYSTTSHTMVSSSTYGTVDRKTTRGIHSLLIYSHVHA